VICLVSLTGFDETRPAVGLFPAPIAGAPPFVLFVEAEGSCRGVLERFRLGDVKEPSNSSGPICAIPRQEAGGAGWAGYLQGAEGLAFRIGRSSRCGSRLLPLARLGAARPCLLRTARRPWAPGWHLAALPARAATAQSPPARTRADAPWPEGISAEAHERARQLARAGLNEAAGAGGGSMATLPMEQGRADRPTARSWPAETNASCCFTDQQQPPRLWVATCVLIRWQAAALSDYLQTADINPNLSINGRFSAEQTRPFYELCARAPGEGDRHGQPEPDAEQVHGAALRVPRSRAGGPGPDLLRSGWPD